MVTTLDVLVFIDPKFTSLYMKSHTLADYIKGGVNMRD
jgi:hypothetical protein